MGKQSKRSPNQSIAPVIVIYILTTELIRKIIFYYKTRNRS